MPARADAPLRKVTVNLYEADCAWAEVHIGHGWTEDLRQVWHDHLTKRFIYQAQRRTLGDLDET